MHWKHSRFQIVYTIVGNCHTVDEAYRVLSELEEDRSFAIESSLAESKRSQSKVLGAKVSLEDPDETKANKLLNECFVDETIARKRIAQPCLDEARRELKFIQDLKSKLNPYRKYISYVQHEANQACQIEEYFLDLLWKTYTYLCSTGMVPPDHLMLIKMHPFSDTLLNELQALKRKAKDNPSEFLYLTKSDIFKDCRFSNILHVSNIHLSHEGEIHYVHNKVPRRIEKIS